MDDKEYYFTSNNSNKTLTFGDVRKLVYKELEEKVLESDSTEDNKTFFLAMLKEITKEL